MDLQDVDELLHVHVLRPHAADVRPVNEGRDSFVALQAHIGAPHSDEGLGLMPPNPLDVPLVRDLTT